jgi:microcystin-dependent protein
MDTYIGSICIFGFNFAPRNWAFCNGQLLAISSNTALFSLLGTYYGGNGTSNFALPNLQGRVANHQGQLAGGSSYTIGETSGTDTTTILTSNLPAHNHTLSLALNANATAVSTGSPAGAFPGLSTPATKIYAAAATSGINMTAPSVTLANAGGSTPISIANPTLVMNYCVCLYGIFPTRN